uniref:Activin_recp domain-containing protein n=1 Tax=Steinernema glaseri TaxID=37863 RepID=A0A1I8ABH3_9BILA
MENKSRCFVASLSVQQLFFSADGRVPPCSYVQLSTPLALNPPAMNVAFRLLLSIAFLAFSDALKCRQGAGVPSNYSIIPLLECESETKTCENITSIWYNTTFFSCSSRPCEASSFCKKEPSAGFGDQFRCCCSDREGCNSGSAFVLSTAIVLFIAVLALR